MPTFPRLSPVGVTIPVRKSGGGPKLRVFQPFTQRASTWPTAPFKGFKTLAPIRGKTWSPCGQASWESTSAALRSTATSTSERAHLHLLRRGGPLPPLPGLQGPYVAELHGRGRQDHQGRPETGETAVELAARYVEEFREDARGLHLIEPDVSPKVSEHIPEIIGLIQKLVDKGVRATRPRATCTSRSASDPDYAKLSKRNLDDLRVGERVHRASRSASRWTSRCGRRAKPGEPAWESPWGPGRPGWHIECSAMSAKYLGETLRHPRRGAGPHLPPPRKRDRPERVGQRQAVRQVLDALRLPGPRRREDVQVAGQRGAAARRAGRRWTPEALRFFFLSTHYRHPLSFADKALADAEARMEYFYETLRKVDERVGGQGLRQGPAARRAAPRASPSSRPPWTTTSTPRAAWARCPASSR